MKLIPNKDKMADIKGISKPEFNILVSSLQRTYYTNQTMLKLNDDQLVGYLSTHAGNPLSERMKEEAGLIVTDTNSVKKIREYMLKESKDIIEILKGFTYKDEK